MKGNLLSPDPQLKEESNNATGNLVDSIKDVWVMLVVALILGTVFCLFWIVALKWIIIAKIITYGSIVCYIIAMAVGKSKFHNPIK